MDGWMDVRIYVSRYVHMYTSTYVGTYVRMHVRIRMHVRTSVGMYARKRVCTYPRPHVRMHVKNAGVYICTLDALGCLKQPIWGGMTLLAGKIRWFEPERTVKTLVLKIGPI